jgi:predicted transcriptional regulator YheO
MMNMTPTLLKHYMKLTEFLGRALGPDYEVVLHDLENENSIVAIANGHVSGRRLAAKSSAAALTQMLSERSYETQDYKINYSGVVVGKKFLRTSSFYIKNDDGQLAGMLCINFDDQRYQNLSNQVLKLCHPDAFVDAHFTYGPEKAMLENLPDKTESALEDMPELADDLVSQILNESGLSASRLTQREKMDIVEALKNKGAFFLKGAVKRVARQLGCSQATIYRYLSRNARNED